MKLLNLIKSKSNNIINENIYTHIGHNIDTYIEENESSNNIKRYNLNEFFNIIKDVISNPTVKQMKNYRQHCSTSCYKHCMQVAYFTYIACKAFKLDYISATRAAMVHDLFLYDWRKDNRNIELPGLHAFVHPKIALKNANMLFKLNDIEKDIILKHMWPVTISFPRYRETYIVTIMDKYSACFESYLYLKNKFEKNTIYKYTYIFLSVLFLRIV